jgi:hypothetical protein
MGADLFSMSLSKKRKNMAKLKSLGDRKISTKQAHCIGEQPTLHSLTRKIFSPGGFEHTNTWKAHIDALRNNP